MTVTSVLTLPFIGTETRCQPVSGSEPNWNPDSNPNLDPDSRFDLDLYFDLTSTLTCTPDPDNNLDLDLVLDLEARVD